MSRQGDKDSHLLKRDKGFVVVGELGFLLEKMRGLKKINEVEMVQKEQTAGR